MCNEVGGIRFRGKTVRVSQMFLAIDVARFMPVEEFTARVEQLVRIMKSTPAAPGYDEVLVAGDPEWRMEAERRVNGLADRRRATGTLLVKAAAKVKRSGHRRYNRRQCWFPSPPSSNAPSGCARPRPPAKTIAT